MIGLEGAAGLAWSAPWWLALAVTAWRWRRSPSLEEYPADAPPDSPLVSVVVPARNEALHIGDCVRAILATRYPAVEVIVVDDHSTDTTAELARAAAGDDRRLRVIVPPPLAEGWVGKQWACHHGARTARGSILLFTDADVRHAPDLYARLLHALRATGAVLVSVAGQQEVRSFWERVVQPFVFALLAAWYGGPGAVNRHPSPRRKIANGQCLCFPRNAYEALGGHARVKGRAAEDLAFAQEVTRSGGRSHLVLGFRQMSTRMYSSLGEIVSGWEKNVYAAGRETLPDGAVADLLARVLVPLPAIVALVPPLALLPGVGGGAVGFAFGVSASLSLVLAFGIVGRAFRIAPWYALTFPLAALVYLVISVRAVARGRRIRWKGREFRVGS